MLFNKSLLKKLILTLFNIALSLATSNASLDISDAYMFKDGISFFKVIAIHPLPVPISITLGLSFSLIILIACSINTSVSKRGIRTFLLTLNLYL